MKYTLKGKGSYLLIPVWAGRHEKSVSLSIDSGKPVLLSLPLRTVDDDYPPTFFAGIPAFSKSSMHSADESHTLLLFAEEDIGESIFSLFKFSDFIPPPKYVSARPKLHFVSCSGWINDPNGLVYKDGVYHMYFQYNPFDTKWQNMSWGHAVSRDLLHWEQKDSVLFPTEDAYIFSGSGIVNDRSLLNLPENALLFFYTYAPRERDVTPFTQKIAYSIDGGYSLHTLNGDCIPAMSVENRDPKVFYHDESKAYICVLWLEKNIYCILRSTDFTDWKEVQRLSMPPAWECPDLFRLKCTQTAEDKWVFWSADGYYLVGNFDGYTFKEEQEIQKAYLTDLPYAAQTFSGIRNEVISIAWLRMKNLGEPYRGAMSLPRSLCLVKKSDGNYYVSHKTVSQYESVVRKCCPDRMEFKGFCDWKSDSEKKEPYDITVESLKDVSILNICIGETSVFSYDSGKENALICGADVRASDVNTIRIIIDGNIAELTNDDYTYIAYTEIVSDAEIRIHTEGKSSLTVYRISDNIS